MTRDTLAVYGCVSILASIPLAIQSPWWLILTALGALFLIVWGYADYRHRTTPHVEPPPSDERPVWPIGLGFE